MSDTAVSQTAPDSELRPATPVSPAITPPPLNADRLLLKYLMQNIREAVVFFGPNRRIFCWNRATENLFGISLQVNADLNWFFDIVQLTPRQHQILSPGDLSVRQAIAEQRELMLLATMTIAGKPVAPVDLQVIPIQAEGGTHLGTMMILHDATYKVNLQQQVDDLMAKSTSDPLTGVNNRAEFERILAECCQTAKASASGFSLIICDIDFFKSINDEFGHDVGDQALVAFAQTVRSGLRGDDVLARFGGEEFVIVCHRCEAHAAIEIAEKIRRRLEQSPQAMLGQKCLTASFGVAPYRPGDSPKSVFVRADKALLRAKESGRNRVVLSKVHTNGSTYFVGANDELAEAMFSSGDHVLVREITCTSPIEVLAAKLEGFVNEQQAKLLVVEPRRVVLQSSDQAGLFRRTSDRRIAFLIEILFTDLNSLREFEPGQSPYTGLKIQLSVVRQRDRRLSDVRQQAEALARSLFSFLMVSIPAVEHTRPGSTRNA